MCKKIISILFVITIIVSCNENSTINSDNNRIENIDFVYLKSVKGLNIDSLYNAISLLPNDTSKVEYLLTTYKLSIKNRPIRTDVLNEALKISKEIDYNTGIAKCLKNIGIDYRYKHEYIKSIKHHKEAIKYFENTWDVNSQIKNLNSLGVSYRRINVEDEAIKYYFKALELSKQAEHAKSMAIAMNGIGNAYVVLGKYDSAIKYFKLSLNFEIISNSVRGTGYYYSNIGEAFMYKEEYDSSFYYHNKALEVANKLNIEGDKAIIYSSVGQMYQHKGDLDMALKYYLNAIPILKKQKRKSLLSFSLINIGKVYLEKGETLKSEKYIIDGLAISKEIATKDNIVSGYEALSVLREIKGNYKSALYEYKNMVIYRDSIFNIKSHYNIVAMDIKYGSKIKDDKIIQLNLEGKIKDSRIIIQFLAIVILVGLTLFFIFYNRIRIKNYNLKIRNMRLKIEGYLNHISKLEERDGFYLDDSNYIINKEEYGLSTREEEVLDLIAQGLKNQDIADKMFISLSTVKVHTKNIFKKLDVRNGIEAFKKIKIL